MRRPAKKKTNGVFGALGAVVLGVAAGAAAVFLSKEENRNKVKATVDKAVKRGKVEVKKAKKQVQVAKKKYSKK